MSCDYKEELRMAEATIREDILQKVPDLFGTKNVNGREVNIERTITTLYTRARSGDRRGPHRAADAPRVTRAGPREYVWPKWDETLLFAPAAPDSSHFEIE
jgi:hypothetical protein